MSASSMAHAGFEWTPPIKTTGPQIQEMPAVPVAEPLPPIDVDIEAFPVDAEESKGVKVMKNTEPPAMIPSPAYKSAPQPEEDLIDAEPVMGFGNDIPLVLAMRQIIPAEYAFIFDPEIDQSMRVSWNGGRPWNVVLEDMVSDAGLGVVVSQQKVWIREDAAETVMDIMEPPVTRSPVFEQKTMPILATESSTEPMDVVLKNKKYEVTETKADDWYKKSPQKEDAFIPPPVIRDDLDYNAISQEDEENYNPSYPRRTPMPVMGSAEDSPKVTDEPVQLSAQAEKGQTVPVREVDMKQPVAPIMKPPAIKPARAQMTEGKVKTFGTSMDPYEIHYWQAEKGDSLRETLANWSSQADVEMFWGAHYDYRLPTPVRMHGTFPDAIKSLLMVYEGSPDRPVGRLHPNLPDGPSVLVIESAAVATQ